MRRHAIVLLASSFVAFFWLTGSQSIAVAAGHREPGVRVEAAVGGVRAPVPSATSIGRWLSGVLPQPVAAVPTLLFGLLAVLAPASRRAMRLCRVCAPRAPPALWFA